MNWILSFKLSLFITWMLLPVFLLHRDQSVFCQDVIHLVDRIYTCQDTCRLICLSLNQMHNFKISNEYLQNEDLCLYNILVTFHNLAAIDNDIIYLITSLKWLVVIICNKKKHVFCWEDCVYSHISVSFSVSTWKFFICKTWCFSEYYESTFGFPIYWTDYTFPLNFFFPQNV